MLESTKWYKFLSKIFHLAQSYRKRLLLYLNCNLYTNFLKVAEDSRKRNIFLKIFLHILDQLYQTVASHNYPLYNSL